MDRGAWRAIVRESQRVGHARMCTHTHTLLCLRFSLEITCHYKRCLGGCLFSVTPSCVTLCRPMDCSPPGSSVPGFSQTRILEGLPPSSLGDCPDPGVGPESLASPILAGRFFTTEPPGKPLISFSFSRIPLLFKGRDLGFSVLVTVHLI